MLITALLIIILSINTQATTLTMGELIYSYDNNQTTGTTSIDLADNKNGTIDGATTGATGLYEEAYAFDGTNDNVLTEYDLSGSVTFTWAFMFKVYDDADANTGLIGYYNDSNEYFAIRYHTDDNLYTTIRLGASNKFHLSLGVITYGTWYKYIVTYDGTKYEFIRNGTSILNRTEAFDLTDVGTGTFAIMEDLPASRYGNGTVDEVGVWSKVLNASEKAEYFSNGLTSLKGLAPPPTDYFRITALTDEDDSTAITDFIAVVNGTTYATTNGSIGTNILNNASVNVTINLTSNYSGGYFSREFSYNVSTDLSTTLYQTITTLTATEKISNNTLTGVFFRNGSEINITSQHFKAGNYTFKFSNSSYFNKSLNYSIPALFNGTINIIEVYNTILNIYLRNAYSNQSINNFTGWVYNQANNYNITHNATPTNTSQTGLIQGLNYTIYAEHPHYSIGPDNYENITINDTSYNLTFYLYSNNSILVYIRDETTNILITDNITITLTFNVSENQYTTTNGTYFFEGLQDGNYSVKFSGANYTTKSYAVTLADKSTQKLTAYLSKNYQLVTFTIRNDLTKAVIEGASFTMARLINSSWVTTESKSSDITGRVQVSYLPAVRYKFTISASNYTTKVFYLDPVIFSSYNIDLDPVISVELLEDYAEVNIVFYPKYFYDGEANIFNWLVTSPKGALTSYYINISFPGGQRNQSGVNAIGEQFIFNFTITGATLYDKVNISYGYDTTLSSPKNFKVSYGILGVATGNNTIENIRQNDYGLGLFEKVMLSIFAVIILAGFTFMLAGSGAGLVVGMLVYGFFVYIGFLPLWSILITLLAGIILVVKLSSDV